MNLLKDKVVIITGGTSGIGFETVNLFARQGAIVYTCGRREFKFTEENIHYKQLDVCDESSCKSFIDNIIDKHQRIDVLVANAGITKDKMTYKMESSDFDIVINTNLKGIFNFVKYVGPFMEQQDYGSIITISSVVGEQGNIGQANYAASKAGIIGMTKSWAKEFSRKGANVRVNTIAPGYILTEMVKTVPQELLDKFSQQTMLKRLGEPIEIANTILFLASDLSSYITGTVIDVNGGLRL